MRLLHQHMLACLQRVNDHRLAHVRCGCDPNRVNRVICQQLTIVAVDSGDIVLLRDLARQLLIQIGDRPSYRIFARPRARDPGPTNPATDHSDPDSI